ncbi:hypothetical protein BCS42_15750 [Crenothrix sp. D3]|nr:hypothetical protein BCS42_15750 [Crenothrix sp. D3]
MKLLKKIAVAAVMTASMLAVSSTAFAAEPHKDLNATIRAAGESTEASLVDAKSLLEKGGDIDEKVKADFNNARQSIKEFRYEATERLRQKMNDKIKSGREAFINNNNEKALADVNAALAIWAEMKTIYAAGHQ